ncbi:MAG: ATP-binding protein [Planctomycetales bacterium]|nr:ATP-binding protein [Planctomycetales bacterium]
MIDNDREVVSALRARLADRIGWDRYEVWFGKGTELLVGDACICVEVSTPFFQDWLRTHFRSDVEAVCAEILEKKVNVEFRVNAQLAQQQKKATKVKGQTPTSVSAAEVSGPRLLKLNDDRVAEQAPCPRALAEFEGFQIGDCNKLAYTSAQIAAERPGNISPLLIHGPTGVGKTHLLESVVSQARRRDRRLHVVYRTAEQFTTDFFEALSGKGVPNFRQKYRGVDLLILDDVQFFAGKKATLIELLHTVETLLREGRQIVLASDRAPAEMAFLGSELVGRLQGGLVCPMDAPDFATRRGIVSRLADQAHVTVSQDVQALIAERITATARELSGALNRLVTTSMALERPLDTMMAEETLAQLAASTARVVRLADIEDAVCDEFGLEPGSLKSNRTLGSISNPRILAMYLARKHTRAALSEISHFFGRRSHSTVITASKKVSTWMNQQSCVELGSLSCGVEDALRRVESRLAQRRRSG